MSRIDLLVEEPARLRECWQRWTGIVADFAHRARHRKAVGEAEYAALHRELLAGCGNAMRQATAAHRLRYEQMHDLAAPWLSVFQLEHADRVILADLLRRCRDARLEMAAQPAAPAAGPRRATGNGYSGQGVWGPVLLAVLALFLVLGGGTLLGLLDLGELAEAAARSGWSSLWRSLGEVHAGVWLVLAGLAAVLVGSLLVMHVRRR
jgi:hypothetical protein